MSFDKENWPPPPDEADPARREARGFAFDQLVACPDCLRANPPTRMNCLYCGAALPSDGAHVELRRPTLRRVEEWEKGFNVILIPDGSANLSETALAEAAALVRQESAHLAAMQRERQELPLARVAAPEEAALIERKLCAFGLHIEIVSDEELAVDASPPRRIRKLDLRDDAVVGWSHADGAAHVIGWQNLALFVQGRIYVKQVEIEERRALPHAESEVVGARELVADEAVLDLYDWTSARNWRITAETFDYSCLGGDKALLARDNFAKLCGALRARAAGAVFDDEYRQLRHLLAAAWPLAERTESRGLRRERPGKFNTEAATCISNETQFTRYGRLRARRARRRP